MQHGRLNNSHMRDGQNRRERLNRLRSAAGLTELAIDRLAVMVCGFGLRLLARAAIVRRCGCGSLLERTRLRRPRARSRAKRERDSEQNCEPKAAHADRT